MNFISNALGLPLGLIMYICYAIAGSYGVAIILFSLITKIIFFPLSVLAQKNSVRLFQIQPKIDELKKLYPKDKERFYDEQDELFKKEKYSPGKGMIPLLVQLALILGMVNVIYNPLKHLMHIPAAAVERLVEVTQQVLGVEQLAYGGQLMVVSAAQDPANAGAFAALSNVIPDFGGVMARIGGLDLQFLGLDLGATPTVAQLSALWLIPLAAGLSSLALCAIQVHLNPIQKKQKFLGKWGMSVFLVGFSVFFTFVVPTGVGVYWIASNLIGIAVALLLNHLYNPNKAFVEASDNL